MMRAGFFAVVVSCASLTAHALAEPDDRDVRCYNAKISARPVEQIPSVIPEPDDPNTIIMRWPWFLDLKVERVLDGEDPGDLVTALSVQHTYMVPRKITWFLRNNTAGGFNIVYPESREELSRCAPDVLPARPYLDPGPVRTLQDERREGEERYGTYKEFVSE